MGLEAKNEHGQNLISEGLVSLNCWDKIRLSTESLILAQKDVGKRRHSGWYPRTRNRDDSRAVSQVARSPWNSVWILDDHVLSLDTPWWPIVNQYREVKLKSPPVRGREIVPEPVCLQAVGAFWLRPEWSDRVPFPNPINLRMPWITAREWDYGG